MASVNKHPYHLVDPSPWPFVGALGGIFLAFGAITFMHPEVFGQSHAEAVKQWGAWKLAPGFALIALTMVMWWRDVTLEGERQGHHTPAVQIGLRYGMLLFRENMMAIILTKKATGPGPNK